MYIFAVATRAYLRDVSTGVEKGIRSSVVATRAYLRDVSSDMNPCQVQALVATRAYLRGVSYKELKPLTKQNNKKAGI